jgi:hypothetical protein
VVNLARAAIAIEVGVNPANPELEQLLLQFMGKWNPAPCC